MKVKMDMQKLKQNLNEEKNKIGLVGGSLTIKEYDDSEHNVLASIDPKNWNIEISLKKGYNPIQDRRQKAYARKKKIDNGLEKLLTDVFTHECAHWELPVDSGNGCPYDTYNHDKILEAVKSELPDDKKQHASYVSNAFEDLMINPKCNEFNQGFSGQVLFWDGEGNLLKEKGQNSYAPIYEAFIKLNMHLFGDSIDKALLKRHYSNKKEIDNAVENIIKDLNLKENIKDTSVLFKKEKWPEMAKVFAKYISPLLDQAPSERLSAFSQDNQDGEGEKKEQPGNGIEQKVNSKEGKEEVAYGRYSNNEKQSSNFTSYEQLDSLYKKLAKSIPVKVETMSKENSLVISPLTYKPFDEEKHDISKIKASKLFLTDRGLEFAYPDKPLVVQAKHKIQRKCFPDFKMIVLDNSGSMKEGLNGDQGNTAFIPWGDNSKYHFALLGFYGIESFLQNQGIAQYIQHGLSLFSSSTKYKESNFTEIDKVRKLALSPEFNSTYLDGKVLIDALKGRESFILSISDGEIGNWSSEKENFKKFVKDNYFAHIQLGGESEFSKDLKSDNIPVFYVNSGKDLSKLMVDITKSTYMRYIKQ